MRKSMLRLRIAHRFGLLTPLLRLQRWADGHDARRGEAAPAGTVRHPAPLS
jgi:hypothetical protein